MFDGDYRMEKREKYRLKIFVGQKRKSERWKIQQFTELFSLRIYKRETY